MKDIEAAIYVLALVSAVNSYGPWGVPVFIGCCVVIDIPLILMGEKSDRQG